MRRSPALPRRAPMPGSHGARDGEREQARRVATARRAPTTLRRPTAGPRPRVAPCRRRVSSSACPSPRKPSARRIAAAAASHGRPARSRPRRSGPRSRRAATAAARRASPSEIPSDGAERRASCGRCRSPPTAGAGTCAEQWCGRVEAERLGDRVPGHVHDDAGHRKRVRECEAEGEHAHVLEARIREQALPGERAPEEGHRDGEREEPEADEERPVPVSSPTAGASARSERQATTSTAGRSAAREQRRDRRRRLRVGVRQPVVHRRPADLGGEAREQEDERRESRSAPASIEASELQREAPRARHPTCGARSTMPRSATPSPRVVSTRYFQPASRAVARAAEPDEQGRRGRRRLDQEPRDRRDSRRAARRRAPPRMRGGLP